MVTSVKAEEIVLGVEDSWAPYSKADGTGLSNRLVIEAYKAVDIDVTLKIAPYSRLLHEVANGRLLGLFNVTKEDSTEDIYHFGEEKLFLARTYYYHHKDKPLKASKMRDLQNLERVGMIIGYEYGPFILQNENVTPVRVRSQDQLIRMILRDRLDTAIMFEAIASDLLPTIKGGEKIEKAFEGQHSNIHVAFSKTYPKHEEYARKLDEGLRILLRNGRWDEILGDLANR